MEDFQGFLACLNLTRLVDSVEERMKSQKGSIRAIKKEQRETAKALRVEQEKLAKALKKAEDKRLREEEKLRIKAEAKAERERLKMEKKSSSPSQDTQTLETPHHDSTILTVEEEMVLPFKLPTEV
jgi:predicted phage gp36 major capsid-like protein